MNLLRGCKECKIPGRHPRPHIGRLGQRSGGSHGNARPDQPGRVWSGEFFRQGEIDLPKLHRGAFGDLGGAFIINPEADKADRDYVQAVNERWTGIKEPHFRRCAVRARENNLPGVTVLAVGHVRAEIVLRCIKLGLINHLILDTDCAQRLNDIM